MDAANGRELIGQFVAESLESLRGVPRLLESFRLDPGDSESINAAFRAVHSVKGCAACLGLDVYKLFVHALENALAKVRDGQCRLTEGLQQALVEGIDRLEAMLDSAVEGSILCQLGPCEEDLLARVETAAAEAAAGGSEEGRRTRELQAVLREVARSGLSGAVDLARRIEALVQPAGPAPAPLPPTPDPDRLTEGRYLCGGQDVSEQVHALGRFFASCRQGGADKPALAALVSQAEEFAGGPGARGRAALAEALGAALADLRAVLASPMDFDAGLAQVVWDRLGPELAALKTDAPRPPSAAVQAAARAAPDPQPEPGASAAKARYVRVKEERLDEFLEDVSGLFITGELLRDLQARMSEADVAPALARELRSTCQELKLQLSALQQSAMALRLVTAAELFAAFPRIARSLAAELGKKVNVHLQGEETEIDRALARELDAPLTHLVRNAVDHGIETPEERRRRGAAEAGNLWLRAERRRSLVRITVEDDGRGIDPARLRAKAVEKGVLAPHEAGQLSDAQALELIFHPGFSTAERVSEVSGRGVGMDVVRTALARHGGRATVESAPGQGARLYLDVPIREAVLVLDGLLVRDAGQQFVVPLEHVREVLHLGPGHLKTVRGQGVAVFRGSCHQTARLGEVLGLEDPGAARPAPGPAALVGQNGRSLCLVFDELLGHRQVVVRRLGGVLSGCDTTQGVALLGGGRMALVVNVPEILAAHAPPAPSAAPAT